ncbi:ThuA domain-containing protein [Pedobacter ginsengisoli]|uniref:ThuA domain-containing protein n=1 Tax=Pedobacter ginsengisoli TaxID=363852 RepID=UPI0012FD45BC|nr:ThuA domain-containing protein [Pedobacter ginsengisoli]
MMKRLKFAIASLIFLFASAFAIKAQPVIHVNQVAYDLAGPKQAVISLEGGSLELKKFTLINASDQKISFSAALKTAGSVAEWFPDRQFYTADFSSFNKPGKYKIDVLFKGKHCTSASFDISAQALAVNTLPSIINYYKKQRANTPQELEADKKMLLFGSEKRVDVHGGWGDASGDISKYFSHLAYANFMSPQQIPLVVWSMVNATEKMPVLLDKLKMKEDLQAEALWGADYMMRSLSDEGYFYMTVFSYFKQDASARRIVGLEANSVTTADYQCAFREGGGMAIASLARISLWGRNGDYQANEYLKAAERAYAHLAVNNLKYTDDGKENIIDDYCALMAATELWVATDSSYYKEEARKRASNLRNRITDKGYFIADDKDRPFWHAADAGLPVVALVRYLDKEQETKYRTQTLAVIKKAIDGNLEVTKSVNNPFGYARQYFKLNGKVKQGFFIPHENETGWWWQGENARLGSLATASLLGGRLIYPEKSGWGVRKDIELYAEQQLSWILGSNPYSMCFMYGFGQKNVPYMASLFGHGSQKGGISNGITGKDGNADGSGIDFKTEAGGNEWRWTEQWIPHAAWFLQALTAIETLNEPKIDKPLFKVLALAENGGHHIAFTKAARPWLDEFAKKHHFVIDYIDNTNKIDSTFLKQYKLVIQLDYPPYAWKPNAVKAFEDYIDNGKGGWLGFHHATLLGEFDGYPMWNWFSNFMGGIRFTNYIADFASANVRVEDKSHPVMNGVSPSFKVDTEEWYTYNKSPRLNVHVLANVDESSYRPDSKFKMGDHPVVWINTKVKAKNVYIFMGHSPDLLMNSDWKRMVSNAILWTAGKGK